MQRELAARVRDMCNADPRLDAALTYGSFPQGQADEHSDIEFWLFHRSTTPDPVAWCESIAPTLAVTVNEFGSHVVFFEGLIRGEFHFATTDDIPTVAGWPSLGAAIDDIIIIDRRGALRAVLETLPAEIATPTTSAEIDELCLRFVNWLLLALHVSRRGETLRAHDALNHARRHLIWMARVATGATKTWLTPQRRAEQDLPEPLIEALHESHHPNPIRAIQTLWTTARPIWQTLQETHDLNPHEALRRELTTQIPR